MPLIFILAIIASSAFAEPQQTMDAVDFLVDRDRLVGKNVIVTGCLLVGANIDNVPCKTGISMFYIDSPTLDREGLRRALRSCSTFDDSENCRADVAGVVSKVNFRLGLSQAKIIWKNR